MTIDPAGSGRVAAQHAESLAQRDSTPGAAKDSTSSSSDRSDRVELSDEGRALASSQDIFQSDPARVAQIQSRIADGSYHTAEVAERIAERLVNEA